MSTNSAVKMAAKTTVLSMRVRRSGAGADAAEARLLGGREDFLAGGRERISIGVTGGGFATEAGVGANGAARTSAAGSTRRTPGSGSSATP